MGNYDSITTCRICRSGELFGFLDLGDLPAVNDFQDSPTDVAQTYPLETVFCKDCNHVQLRNTVARATLFENYTYFSSASDPMVDHFGDYADTITDRFLTADDLVVEIGSNDGILLGQLPDKVRAVGVEPAHNVAKVAEREHDLDVITEMFDSDVASRVETKYGRAAAVLANNVVGHVDDLRDFAVGVDTLLADDGVFVLEVPYLVDLLNDGTFDTMYHEHISYFCIRPMATLLDQRGLEIFDVERQPVHGGSIRVYAQRRGGPHDRTGYVDDLTTLERHMGLADVETYDRFANQIEQYRERLTGLLEALARQGTVAGYGASAKGNVLLNYCGLDSETIDYIVDTTPAKQNTYAPGTAIPVEPPSKFQEHPPDYALLLAWNYTDAILAKETEFREAGGRFVIPQPKLDVV